jgi:hypothetical protein
MSGQGMAMGTPAGKPESDMMPGMPGMSHDTGAPRGMGNHSSSRCSL